MNLRILYLIIISTFLFSCEDDHDDVPFGAYRYSGFDSTHTAIVSGWLLFENEDSTQLSGEWSLDAIGSPPGIGPQIGTGMMTGGNDNGNIWINLNPGWVDNNVFLSGTFEDDGVNKRFRGKWNWSGFPGVLNHGTFSSIKEE